MKLRIIILTLSSLVFLSTLTGGYFYYSGLKSATIERVQTQGKWHAESIKNEINHQISANKKVVKGLSGNEKMRQTLTETNKFTLNNANKILDYFNSAFEADVTYLMDREGNTIGSSNRNDSDSFVGKNYAFRPYFNQAIKGTPSVYAALGVTSGKRGLYFSHPVYGYNSESPLGVVVIKASVEKMENELLRVRLHSHGMISLLSSPDGVIFMSDSDRYLFQLLEAWPDGKTSKIETSKQFGDKQPKWSGFEIKNESVIIDQSGSEYLFARNEIPSIPGWHIYHLHNTNAFIKSIYAPLFEKLLQIIFTLCAFTGVAVSILYRMAHKDIFRRRIAEKERDNLIHELKASIKKIKTLEGIVPMCSHCKKVRDDKGYWNQIDHYIADHSDADISHGICPDCAEKFYPEMNLYGDDDN